METERKLMDFIAEELQAPRDVLSTDYPLIDSRLVDSMGLLQIVSFLESAFDVEVEDEELVPDNFGTIGDIVRLVELKQKAKGAA